LAKIFLILNHYLIKYLLLSIKSLFKFPPHPTSASALPGEIRPSIIHVEMNEKSSLNFICPDMLVPTAGLLQNLSVVQQCLYQIMFRNVYEFKKRLVKLGFWSRTLLILLSVNRESISMLMFA